jgi:SnoaL-like domain
MTEQEQSARAAIAKTLGACTQAGDSRKADAYAACFSEDGVLELLNARHAGREAIRTFMAAPSVIPQPSSGATNGRSPGFVSHHLTTCRIELSSAGTATVRTYWLVTTAVGLDHNGYYDDRFVRVGDEWLIAHRRPRTLWTSPDSLLHGAS